ncbi:MAG: sugar nucleotide-binding protein [Puniceicoccaceae bacterium]
MVILLGGSGYVGGAYQRYFQKKGIAAESLSRAFVDYSNPWVLEAYLRKSKASFLINCAGFTGKPNVDACEERKADTLEGNALLPDRVRLACESAGVPWGHVSSGCIYSGRRGDGQGFEENDEPNFSFRSPPCSFYSGTKALGEEILKGAKDCYIWRLRIPFDSEWSPRNFLVKLIKYDILLDAENSISHLEEFVAATFACWEKRIPFGVYNVTQPGSVTARQVTEWMGEERDRRERENLANPFPKTFRFFASEDEFMRLAARTPRSNCVLSTEKLEGVGIKLTPAEVKVRECLRSLGLVGAEA